MASEPTTKEATVLSTSTQSIITGTGAFTKSATPSISAPSSSDPHPKATSALIAASVLGALDAVIIFVTIFVLWRRRRRGRSRSESAVGDPHSTDDEPITSNDPRRVSEVSRTAYEDEIGRLRELIRIIDEEMNYSSAPPSYRGSRSRIDVSEPLRRSSSRPLPVPPREIAQ